MMHGAINIPLLRSEGRRANVGGSRQAKCWRARVRTGSGPGSPRGQPAWGGGCDRIIDSPLISVYNVSVARSAAGIFRGDGDMIPGLRSLRSLTRGYYLSSLRDSLTSTGHSLVASLGWNFRMSPLNFTGEERPALQIQLCCFQQLVVVPALVSAPFGMPAITFWMYVCASLLFIIGLIKIFGELSQEHAWTRSCRLPTVFFAIPMAVFGSEHFTATWTSRPSFRAGFRRIPFWVYLVGAGFLCAALSITVLVQARPGRPPGGMTT